MAFHLDAAKDWTTLAELVRSIEGGNRVAPGSARLLGGARLSRRFRHVRKANSFSPEDGPRRLLSHLKLMDRTNEGDKREAMDVLTRLHKHGEVTQEVYNEIAAIIGVVIEGEPEPKTGA